MFSPLQNVCSESGTRVVIIRFGAATAAACPRFVRPRGAAACNSTPGTSTRSTRCL